MRKITSQDANMGEELNSAQEEVDTRLILYAAHAALIHIFRLIVYINDLTCAAMETIQGQYL